MRRWRRATALGAVTVLALAGCGVPEGTDGDLVDDWAALATPVVFQPANDTCHPNATDVGYLTSYNPVDCGRGHQAETVHVGALTGAHADLDTLPSTGSAARQAAYAECERAANRALGADYRSGRVGLYTVLPSERGWQGGARWFRCDLVELSSLDNPSVKEHAGSLRGALSDPSSPLALRCFTAVLADKRVDEMVPVACTQKHDAEFVGVYQAPAGSYAAFDNNSEKTHQACLRVVATYAKLPKDGNLKYRAGTIAYQPDEDEWRDGNRGVKCFLWTDTRKLTRSVKGGGTKVLPIQYG